MDRAHLPHRENCPSVAEAQVLAEASVLSRLCLTLVTTSWHFHSVVFRMRQQQPPKLYISLKKTAPGARIHPSK